MSNVLPLPAFASSMLSTSSLFLPAFLAVFFPTVSPQFFLSFLFAVVVPVIVQFVQLERLKIFIVFYLSDCQLVYGEKTLQKERSVDLSPPLSRSLSGSKFIVKPSMLLARFG